MFISKFVIPLSIKEWIMKDEYKLELLPKLKVHSLLPISLLNPRGKEEALWPNHKYVIWPPPNLVGDHLEHEVLGTFKSRLPLDGRNLEGYMRYGKCH